MSMGFDFLQSSPSDQGIDLDIGDLKLQYNAALEELNFVSVSFESYMDACNRVFALFDAVEANEGMLDPVVRDFVNRNGELSMALGIDLAMEDDSQDAQKQNGEAVTEKKQGILRRMWEGIKKFFRAILDAIGSFFHWLGNLFAGTSKRIDWLKSDGKESASKLTNIPASDIKQFIVGQEKDGKTPFQVVAKNSTSTESFDSFAIESDNDQTEFTFDYHWIGKAFHDLEKLYMSIKDYIYTAKQNINEGDNSGYKSTMQDMSRRLVNSITLELLSLLDIKSIKLSESGKFEINTNEKRGTTFKVDLLSVINNYDDFVGLSEKMLMLSYDVGERLSKEAQQTIKQFDTLVETFGKDTAMFLKTVASNITFCLNLFGKIVNNIDKLNIDLKKSLILAASHVNQMNELRRQKDTK